MKEFTLLGTTLNYSTQRLNYYSIHSVFLELAQTSWKQFYSDYQRMGSLQKAYEQLPKVIVRLVKSIDSSCEDYIKLQKIYSVGADDVGAGCTSALRELQQIYQERIAEPCEEIEERKNAEVAQREFKKKIKSNDLWDSLGYSAINAVGNLGSSLNASLDASSIYKNSDTLDQFKNAILDYVILAQRATMRLVQENSNIGYCERCYHHKVGDALHSYSYKPSPIFHGDGSLYLGVELEVDGAGKSTSNARAILNVMNRHVEYVYIKTDGSLDDGLEVVTHPCTLEEHRIRLPWKEGLDAIRSMHYCSHNAGTCGLHVHVNRDGLGHNNAAQDETIGKILYLFERFWQEVLRFSRRTESQMNHWAARYGYKNSGKEILEHAKYDSGNGRYACVNLTNCDTIEFRAFRGTLKYNTLIATLQFVAHICKVALSLSEEEIQDLGWPQLVLLLTDESTPELIQYLKERRLYINEPVPVTEWEV